MKNKKLSLTIGIPTRFGGKSLVSSAKSIVASAKGRKVQFLVVADTVPFSSVEKKQLNDLGVKIVWNKTSGGQFKKVKQLVKLAKNDVFVSTQDDIVFQKNTIEEIMEVFEEDPEVTMVSTKVRPLKATTFFEKVIEVGVRVAYETGVRWNKGDNYILSNGRCIAFRTKFIKGFDIREKMINGDAYLYFENKFLGGKFKHASKAVVYNRSPQKLSEHINQTSRFQLSKEEMESYFKRDLSEFYNLPKMTAGLVFLREFIKDPFYTFLYFGVLVYTKLLKKNRRSLYNPLWKADLTTKRVG